MIGSDSLINPFYKNSAESVPVHFVPVVRGAANPSLFVNKVAGALGILIPCVNGLQSDYNR